MAANRNRILNAADKYTRQGKLEAAIAELLKLAKDNPRDMTTINRLGDLYARLGKTSEAVVQFTKIADFYNNEGFLLKSIAIYKKVTKLDPTSMKSYQALARLYSQQGLIMEARAQFQIVADHHVREGVIKAALNSYREMLELEPHDLKIQLTIAGMLERTGDSDEALAAYRHVGADLDRRGMYAESRKVYEAALRVAPGHHGALRSLVISLRRQEASGEALRFLSGVLESRPDDAELLSLVGDAHLDNGDTDQARELYEQVRKQAPDRPESHLNEARLALKAGNPDACFDHIEKAVPAVMDAGRYEMLVAYVLELLDARPHHVDALGRLVELHAVSGQEGPARDACIRLAGACMEQDRLEDAAGALERLIKMDPENPRHQDRLQDVLARIKQEGRAYPPVPAAAAEPAPEGAGDAGAAEPAEPANAVEFAPDLAVEPEIELVADIEAVLPSTEEEEIDTDFVAEHMTEAEVFMKYGLVDRAVEQLQHVLDRYPEHLPAHEALLGIYREEGNRGQAAAQYRSLARIHQARGETEKAQEALREAELFDPAGAGATPPPPAAKKAAASPPAAAGQSGAGATAARQETAAEDLVEPAGEEMEIDLDAAQAAEVVPIDRLEETDALIEGGALEEARRRLVKLRSEFPERSEIEERLQRIGLLEEEGKPQQAPEKQDAEAASFFDLAAELDETLFEPQTAVGEEPEAEGHSLGDLVEAFKKGVEQQVDSEDFETHYNLAIAYKEMGLVDEAIGEFQFSSKAPEFFLKCCSMLGLCFREKGMTTLAVKWYLKGVEVEGGDEEELLGLRYDLAALYQDTGEAGKALEIFTDVYGVNAKYRDVAERLDQLRGATSGS